MELALYCPEYGFYEKEADTVGWGGDFYTSVSVGGLFGQLLAFQFAEWFGNLPIADCRLPIVEAGAHDGKLAWDILGWLREHRPALFERVEYCIIEPSPRRRAWQTKTLESFGTKVRWLSDLSALARHDAAGGQIIFANELLDAMPVHRLGWDATKRAWFEWGVGLSENRFVWQRLNQVAENSLVERSWLAALPEELLSVLPDGYVVEISPAAEQWWSEAARSIASGWLLTFDYGFTTEELLRPERREGTLRSYRQHRLVPDVLADPGKQDITAHVNFSAIQSAGEAAGLTTESFEVQGRFLTKLAARLWHQTGGTDRLSEAGRRQFQSLTHPQNLGQSFRALVQRRG
ncbi:MAG: hypothetical protein EPO07_12560 [Verrucomicrobia bacterium]|nr:MAG: hypothetical protein EPO07_12560 [Verrucomicrobiota bacterium]